jgi:putative membrane protein
MWRVTLLAGAVLAMGFAFVGTTRAADEAPAGSTAKLEKDDMKFVRSANAGGEMEVALGKLAESKGVDLTKGKEKRQQKIDDKVADLSKKTGADFDKAYVDDMVEDHEKDVKEFKKQAEAAKDEDVKKWAAQTLPTLEEHLKMIKDIQAKMK